MSDYYDREGNAMTLESWMPKFSDRDYKIISRTEVGEVVVSTVWLGLDHQYGDGPPLIFETMIFGGDHDEDQWRYSTELAAREHHGALVAAIEAGESLPGPLEVAQKETRAER